MKACAMVMQNKAGYYFNGHYIWDIVWEAVLTLHTDNGVMNFRFFFT